MNRGCIHIGTSGWHYPHWVGQFYPRTLSSDHFLPYYAQHLTTVEINNTFYRLPTPQILVGWLTKTPKDFLFTCKASRFITHMKKLKDPKPSIKQFFETVKILKEKLGPILFQLPPRWKINVPRLEEFLKILPKTFSYAFEFRDGSWLDKRIYQLLTNHNAAFCLYNLAGKWSPEIVTADFVYIRLHGPGDPYKGRYSETMLRSWANKCLHWANMGKNVYCFFDNDEQAYAITNALSLKKQITTQQQASNPTP
jgi:uncharacterized protein YecE (DUF72 family)